MADQTRRAQEKLPSGGSKGAIRPADTDGAESRFGPVGGVGPPYAETHRRSRAASLQCRRTKRASVGGVMRPFHASSRKKRSNAKLFLTSLVKVTAARRDDDTIGFGACFRARLLGQPPQELRRRGPAGPDSALHSRISPSCLSCRRSSGRRSCRSPCPCGW